MRYKSYHHQTNCLSGKSLFEIVVSRASTAQLAIIISNNMMDISFKFLLITQCSSLFHLLHVSFNIIILPRVSCPLTPLVSPRDKLPHSSYRRIFILKLNQFSSRGV